MKFLQDEIIAEVKHRRIKLLHYEIPAIISSCNYFILQLFHPAMVLYDGALTFEG